jgi:hypothetical protein
VSAPALINDCETHLDQKISLAVFPNEKTSHPEKQLEIEWAQFRRLLTVHTVRDGKSGKGFVPAKLTGNRANSNVEHVSLAVMDSDQGVPFDEGIKRLQGYDAVLYTTHSHSEDHHKWRAAIRLKSPVRCEDFRAFRAEFAAHFGGDINDPQCTDPARFYYFPSCPEDKAHIRRTEILEGKPLDPAPLIERGCEILQQRKAPVTINRDLESGINRAMPETPENIAMVKEMLAVLDAACDYGIWRNIGWALASLGWACGFDLFDEWSKTTSTVRGRNEH